MEAGQVRYDEKADVLSVWSKDPGEIDVVSEETGDEILVERDADTGEKIGVTILHFSKREGRENGIELENVL